MNTPTNEQIARQAEEIWHNRGCPVGCDMEIWLQAERFLRGDAPPAATFAERAKAETAAESEVEYQISPAGTQQESIKAALQKIDARTPQIPRSAAPNVKPPESGKPLWPKPRQGVEANRR